MADLELTGPISLPLANLQRLVASCAAWHDWIGADGADDVKYAAAVKRVHLIDVPPPDANADEYTLDQINQMRPLAVVDIYDRPKTYGDKAWLATRISDMSYLNHGILLLHVEANVNAQLSKNFAQAKITFINQLGGLLDDMLELSGTDDHLYIRGLEIMAIARPDTTELTGLGDFFLADIKVDWGVGG